MKRLTLLLALFLTYSIALPQTRVTNFGSNPGNLAMYVYSPPAVPDNAPLVLALHGCTQSATSYALESGWNSLADSYGFHVIYAEQNSANNSSKCFNWFESQDIARGSGEAASLKSMVDYMKNHYSLDNTSVFVTGFSAGGAMTTVMMATYPDVFAAGAVMSGLPYKVAIGSNAAFMAMFGNVNKSPQELGSLVKNAYPSYSGPWPRLATFHGTSDYTVYFMNQRELMEQWTDVHGVDQTSDEEINPFVGNPAVTKKSYRNSSEQDVVVSYSITGMGHAVAVDPGSGEYQGGATGSYATDVNFFSSYYAAEFFGITGSSMSPLEAPDNIQAVGISDNEIRLTWRDKSTAETAYEVERSEDPENGFSTVANLAANIEDYNDTGLSPDTKYHYKVTAIGLAGERATGNIISATTLPTGDGGSVVTIEQLHGNGILSYNNNQNMGQSFTSPVDGTPTSVLFNLVNPISNSTLKIYEGNTVSGSAFFEQSNISKSAGWQTISLQNGPALSNGQQYTILLTNSSLKYSYSNVYAGGNFWYGNIAYGVFDAAFKVELRTIATTSARRTAVPTSEQDQITDPFLLYPNPANKRLYFQTSFPGTRYQIEIISPRGAILKLPEKINADQTNIDLSSIPPGLYLVRVSLQGKHYTRKVMIQR
ncbi:Poly(3-hydroxyalkanoate) depolymerase C precursor [Fulvivirga imtechensis AK7]|uniref:Poly(3-hydroxyalkanoate) depolymerase C n=1 Tax=Fulvivirga imtechensis AK7 TaxID=1237149 RepID=L8JNW8_9BACT|nr:PHB depolymerase family esterase [Fulvivirga imtechensis]ELR70535.1 Poly(3-hydroxyalkanoate) depolymerase C precursor [Fulvivirga imtechensis AK7]